MVMDNYQKHLEPDHRRLVRTRVRIVHSDAGLRGWHALWRWLLSPVDDGLAARIEKTEASNEPTPEGPSVNGADHDE